MGFRGTSDAGQYSENFLFAFEAGDIVRGLHQSRSRLASMARRPVARPNELNDAPKKFALSTQVVILEYKFRFVHEMRSWEP